MIPNDAVTAAAKELWDVDQRDDVWVDDFATYDAFLRHKARIVLEAAAPHLMEQAWDECEAASYEIRLEPGGKFWQPYKDNPYRKPTSAD